MKFSIFKNLSTGIVMLIAFGWQISVSFAQSPVLSVQDLLRFRIEAGGVPLKISVGNEPVHAATMLPIFYERRAFQPAWTDSSGPLPQTEALRESIRQAEREGLRPDDYHLEIIATILSEVRQKRDVENTTDLQQMADLDLLLTDAFLIYSAHLLAGRVNPEKIYPQWFASRREADLARLLEEALNSNRVGGAIEALLPKYAGYNGLRDGLATYRKFAETGWPTIPSGRKLEPGERSERIFILRQRLAAEGFVTDAGVDDQEFFDNDLEDALKNFQMQNGLEADGILGPQTLQALNISAGKRVRQIAVNMERWRWLPQNLGDPHVLVNIAGFNLDVVESEMPVLNMRVVVGKTYRKTPVFSDKITYLVLNPYWGVPDTIARNDILPKIKKEPNYLVSQKIRVFKGSGGNAGEIQPNAIDWGTISANKLPYRFKQDPGPHNVLGRIKFMFPNQFNVYLHDTPSKELFGKARRDFSSGCIRVEKPMDLAQYLLRGQPDWPPDKIRSALSGSDFSPQTIKLKDPVNIHIQYWTSWIGEDSRIHFRPDIYDRDAVLDAAIQELPPGT